MCDAQTVKINLKVESPTFLQASLRKEGSTHNAILLHSGLRVQVWAGVPLAVARPKQSW